MHSKKISERSIDQNATILSALKQMDNIGIKSLIVIDNNQRFSGILSIGDIQRAIINEKPLESSIKEIIRSKPKIASENTTLTEIKELMMHFRMEFLPVVNNEMQIIKIYYWEDIFGREKKKPSKDLKLPVIIMAGGVGTRLKPLTNVLPKPLIPIGEKTIIEEIIDRFGDHGCTEFYISLNYKADLVEYYLKNLNLLFNLKFIKEDKPSGTAGSLSLLKDIIRTTFFVTNCDIIIEQDYSEILDYHVENKNEITIISALKHYPLSYGIIETGENGQLVKIQEKPEYTFKINSGMYILEPHLLTEIPENTFFHITELINKLIIDKRKIGVFPISQKSWYDIGEWDEFISNTLKI
jgi:dTDP-glucose pyrophosphorylase